MQTCCGCCRPETGSKIVAFVELAFVAAAFILTGINVGFYHWPAYISIAIGLIMFAIHITGIYKKSPACLMTYLIYTGIR